MARTDDGCGFCGQTEAEGRSHYVGRAGRICSSCIDLCWDIIGPEDRISGWPPMHSRGQVTECAFCGRDDAQAKVWGPRLFICAMCVADARRLARPPS